MSELIEDKFSGNCAHYALVSKEKKCGNCIKYSTLYRYTNTQIRLTTTTHKSKSNLYNTCQFLGIELRSTRPYK